VAEVSESILGRVIWVSTTPRKPPWRGEVVAIVFDPGRDEYGGWRVLVLDDEGRLRDCQPHEVSFVLDLPLEAT